MRAAGRQVAGATAPQLAPLNANPLAANPAYLAFLRELGIADAEAAADTTTGAERVGLELARRLPRIAELGGRDREGISGSFESRGLFRSGQHELTLARQRADEGNEAGDLVAAGADRVADLQADLARRRAAAARRRAEGALSAAGDAHVGMG
ncbi:MAG: hypothetical protein ACLGIO_04945 [Acidimicrobiia bacterium]